MVSHRAVRDLIGSHGDDAALLSRSALLSLDTVPNANLSGGSSGVRSGADLETMMLAIDCVTLPSATW